MFSADAKAAKALLAGFAALAFAGSAGVAHAQSVVVRSTGPSAVTYPQGKKLPANAKVTLRQGDKLTVLDKAGSRVLAGPGSFTLDGTVARDAGAGTRIAGVVSGGAARTRTGAVRGAGAVRSGTPAMVAAAPDSVWYIDVSKGGTYCVADPATLVLWRPNRTESASGKLALAAGGKPIDVTWNKGNPLRLWPSKELPVSEGARFTFSDPVGPTVPITIRLVGPVPADDLAVAGLFADKGCMAQLDVFANAAASAASAGS